MTGDKVKEKLYLQKIRNCIKSLKGLELIRILEEGEMLYDIGKRCLSYSCVVNKEPDAVISSNVSEEQLLEWVKQQTGIQTNRTYYFLCLHTWIEFQMTDLSLGIKSLWEHEKYLEKCATGGFIVVDEALETWIEVGNDSRDEEHYLCDKYFFKDMEVVRHGTEVDRK